MEFTIFDIRISTALFRYIIIIIRSSFIECQMLSATS